MDEQLAGLRQQLMELNRRREELVKEKKAEWAGYEEAVNRLEGEARAMDPVLRVLESASETPAAE